MTGYPPKEHAPRTSYQVGGCLYQTQYTTPDVSSIVLSNKIIYWCCACSLALLVFVLAFACIVPNRSGHTLLDLIGQAVQNYQVGAYMDEHRGEQSAAEKAAEKGLVFDYGLSIATNFDSPGVDVALIAYANQQLAYVPDYIKSMFSDDGWVVCLSPEDLGTRFQTRGFEPNLLRGLTSYDDHVIYLDANAYSIESAAVHEMGHYFDLKLGFPSDGEAFAKALESDRDMFSFYFSCRSETEASEMFAEMFSTFCKDREAMKQYCPSAYAYFSEMI